jgi:8-oxo-dGTP pyrophosphatase MutT (NUDIX family)
MAWFDGCLVRPGRADRVFAMTAPPRTIHLRRPPVLTLQDGVFVPEVDRNVFDEVERRWRAICEASPAAFDGRVCHVLGIHRNGHGGATIHASDCAYRFHAVQDDGFDLGIRPLGVKGLVVSGEHVLVGRRSRNVAWYAGLREFAPGGVVEPGVEPAVALERELLEETGLSPASPPTAITIVYDAVTRTWEIIYQIQPSSRRLTPMPEYESIEWMRIDALSGVDDFTPISRSMIPMCSHR